MARKTFFSFHYENDVWRANIVRNSWVTKSGIEEAGFIDSVVFEEVKQRGSKAVKDWINEQLIGTSVTVVLIGIETSNRDYVIYELEQSWKRGNGILGIYIHNIKDKNGYTSAAGDNNFGPIFTKSKDNYQYFFQRFFTFDWFNNNGYDNLGDWIENAAKQAGK